VAIAIVQVEGTGNGGAGTSLNVPIAATVAGNSLIMVGSWGHSAGQSVSVTTTGGTGADTGILSVGIDNAVLGSFNTDFAVWVIPSVGAGRTNVIINYGISVGFSDFIVYEVSGLPNAVVDKNFFSGVQTTSPVDVGPTSTLTTANEFCIAYQASSTTAGIVPTPWTSDIRVVVTSSTCGHQIVSSTSGVFVLGTPGGGSWAELVATFMSPPSMSVVQSASAGANNPSSLTATFPATTTPANCVIAVGSWSHNSAQSVTLTTTGGAGADTGILAYGITNATVGALNFDIAAWIIPSVGARSGITINYGTTVGFGDLVVYEVSGLPNTVIDKTVFSGAQTATTVNVGPTATLAASSEFCLAYQASTALAGQAAPQPPWVHDQMTTTTGSTCGHQIVSSNSGVSISGGAGAGSWMELIATFMTQLGGLNSGKGVAAGHVTATASGLGRAVSVAHAVVVGAASGTTGAASAIGSAAGHGGANGAAGSTGVGILSYFNIDNNGVITVTAAGVAAITTPQTFNLIVQASNAYGQGTGGVTVNVQAASAWQDGLANAPTGAPQSPNILNIYAPSGQPQVRNKSYINQPPFNVPGVDYRVGVQTGVTLIAPNSGNMPSGASFDGTTISITGANVTVQNFVLNNQNIVVQSTATNPIIKNCQLNFTAGGLTPIVFQDCNTTGYVGYCELYCNHVNQGVTPTDYGAITWRNSVAGNYTIEYCYLNQVYCDVFSGIGGSFNVTIQYNYINDNGYGNFALVSPAPGSHPDVTQWQQTGQTKMWNNCSYLPPGSNWGTQGFMTENSVYPSMTCQNVIALKGTGATTFSIALATGYNTTTSKFLFQNNYLDHPSGFSDIYPGYPSANVDLGTPNSNFNMVTGAAFS
jgi:hypothetical protein